MPVSTTDQHAAFIASEAVEVLEDHLLFPGGTLLPLGYPAGLRLAPRALGGVLAGGGRGQCLRTEKTRSQPALAG
jgi:hypothetical protein